MKSNVLGQGAGAMLAASVVPEGSITQGSITQRRGLLLGAGAVGAAALAAKSLSLASADVQVAAQAKPAPDTSGGYQETQHVLRYYATTRV